MTRAGSIALVSVVLAALALGAALVPSASSPRPRILVFTKTAGFRHASIPAALRAIRQLGEQHGLVVDATGNAGAFTGSNLARYDAVVFVMTTGDVLNPAQESAFQRYFRSGGGFAGVHSAADTEYGWSWYGRMLGARFRSHPQIQSGAVDVATLRHPSTAGLPRRWVRIDEWYNFRANPRSAVRVLATLDETSYSPGEGGMGADHPIAWSHEFQGGRAWFTAGGHTEESYSEPLFRRHLIGGIRYAAGLTPPRIRLVTTTVRDRRLTVSVRYTSCLPCAGELLIRSSATPIRTAGGRGQARSPRLSRGRWPFVVVLKDRATGLQHGVRRWAIVR